MGAGLSCGADALAVRRLDLIITSNATAALRGFASLEAAAKRMENRFGAAGRAMFNIGVIGAAGAVAFTAKSVQAFIAFDEQMVKSTAILDNISGPVRRRLEDAAKAVAKTTTFSATEAAEAYYGLFSAGMSAEQAISALPVVAQFAQAGLMDLATATDFLVNSQSALGLAMEDPIENMRQMQRVADVLTETNNLATGTVEEFAQALTHKAGGALKTVNKDIEEGAAALAYLAEQGVRGSRAGESLAIFIRDVSRAAGNASFRDAFRKFGIEVFNAEGNLKNLADVVAEFEQALGPMNDEQRATTLEQLGLTRSVGDVIRQFMGGSDAIRGYEEALRNAGGATQGVADKQMESLRAKIDLVKNRFNVMMIEFGEPVAIWLVETFMPWFETVFVPALAEAGVMVRDDLKPAFEALAIALDNPTFVKVASAFAGYVVAFNALKPVVKMVGGAVAFLGKPLGLLIKLVGFLAKPIFKALIPAFKILAAVVTGLAAALGLPVWVVVAIIAAVVAAGVAIYVWRDQLLEATQAVGRFFGRLWGDIWSGFVEPTIDFFTGPFVDFWKRVWKTVQDLVGKFIKGLKVYLTVLVAIFAAPFIIIGGIIVAFFKALIKIFNAAWPVLSDIIVNAWNKIVDITVIAWQRVIYPAIKSAVDFIWLVIRIAFFAIEFAIKNTWMIVKTITLSVWAVIKGALLGAWHTIRDRVAKPLASFWSEEVMPRLRTFGEALKTLWTAIKDTFGNAWTWIKDHVGKPFADFWSESVGPKLSAFRDFISNIWTAIREGASAAWERILSAIRTPVNAIIKVINALIDGMNTVIGLINEIPGVSIPNIPKIPLIGATSRGSTGSEPTLRGGAHAMGTYDLAKRGPFKTNGPRAIVGEGDPRFPEYVIPTDPRYRNRANSLFAGLASDLGMGYQFGGIIDSVKSGIGGLIDAAGGVFGDLTRGALKAAFAPFNEAAKAGLNRLPNVFELREIAQGFRELVWRVVTGADSAFPDAATVATGSGAGLTGDRAANRRLGQQLNSSRGWAAHWGALDALVMSESGWNNFAQNPTSTAMGIGQFLDCLPLDTEILTRTGWKKYHEVKPGEETLALNPETGKTEWSKILHVVIKEPQELVKIGNDRWSARVTPRHRWASTRRTSKVPDLSACPECGVGSGKRGLFTSARAVQGHRSRVHGAEPGSPEIIKAFEFVKTDSITKAHDLILSAPADTAGELDITTDEARLIGWALGDGTLQTHWNDAGYTLHLYQSKPEHVDDLRDLIDRTSSGRFSDYARKRPAGNFVAHDFYVHAAYSKDLLARSRLAELGPEGFVLALSTEQRQAALEALCAAEGSQVSSGEDGEVWRIAQAEGAVQDAIVLCAYLCGYRPRCIPVEKREPHHKNAHRITLSRPRSHGVSLAVSPAGKEPVWCVQTELGTWTMRQAGQILLTGNSTWAGVGYKKTTDPRIQILAMLEYILQRYGNPSKAWTFKKANNWYELGGMLPGFASGIYRVPRDNFPANLHEDEMVVSSPGADAIRDALGRGRGSGNTYVHIDKFVINLDGDEPLEVLRRKARASGKAFIEYLEERRVLTDARIS